MPIDDLLQQMDQNRARQGYGPRSPSTSAADAEVRANAQRLRTKGVLPGGEQPSAAARAAQAARSTPNIAQPPPAASATAAAPEATAARGSRLSRVARAGARIAAPALLGLSAAETGTTPTETYYKRFGIEPRNDGTITGDLIPNIAIRALGAASDLGNTLTGGLAGDMFFRDRAPVRPPQRAAVPAPVNAGHLSSTPNDPGGKPNGRIYQLGNQYSDQPIAGGVEFDPRAMRGGFAISTSGHVPNASARMRDAVGVQELNRAQRLADRDERVQRERDAFNSFQMQRAITGGTPDPAVGATAASQAANERRSALRLIENAAKGRNGISARGQREALSALGEVTKGGSQARSELAPGVDRNTNSPTDVLRSHSQGAIEDEQAIAAGLMNQQALRAQQIMEQLQQIGPNTSSDKRRTLIDRALVSQGKDPDANRYEAIEAIGGLDAMGNPITTRSLYDTHTGQIIGGAPAAAPAMGQESQQAQYQEGTVYTDAHGNRARYVGGKFVPM